MFRPLHALALLAAMLLPSFAAAGSSEATGESIHPIEDVAAFSNRVQQDLAARDVYVAIVARKGRDPETLPDGITYTHVAYWVYSNLTLADGSSAKGYRVYNLYQTAEDETVSRLVQDSPTDFFAGAWELDAGIIIPDPRLQKKLLQVIASPTYTELHNARYSVLANPANGKFQNCTEHTMDVMMASLYGTADKAQIKANLKAHFEPQPVKIGGLKRLLAPAASAALTTKDHGSTVKTATFGSIARFMKRNDLSATIYRITPDAAYAF